MPRLTPPRDRRARHRIAAGAAAWLLAACVGAPPTPVAYSQATYDRTYDAAFGALTDQKLVVGEQNRRGGRIVGHEGDLSIVVTLEPLPDGTIRVAFQQQPKDADPALLKRVAEAYNTRMGQRSLLGGFKGENDDLSGPRPCPGGPALCP